MPDQVPEGEPAYAEDVELLRRARQGDAASRQMLGERLGCVGRFLGALHKRYGQRLSAEELQDLSQDVQVVLLERLSTYAGRAKLETWVWHVCRGKLLNYMRDLERRRSAMDLEGVEAFQAESLDAGLQAEEVHAALSRVGPPEEDVVRLRFFDNLRFSEIAARTGLRLGTVKTYFYRGLARFESNHDRNNREDIA